MGLGEDTLEIVSANAKVTVIKRISCALCLKASLALVHSLIKIWQGTTTSKSHRLCYLVGNSKCTKDQAMACFVSDSPRDLNSSRCFHSGAVSFSFNHAQAIESILSYLQVSVLPPASIDSFIKLSGRISI